MALKKGFSRKFAAPTAPAENTSEPTEGPGMKKKPTKAEKLARMAKRLKGMKKE